MDTLVAHYSRPAFEKEGYSQQEQHELSQITPPLSLRFALPPIANVRLLFYRPYLENRLARLKTY